MRHKLLPASIAVVQGWDIHVIHVHVRVQQNLLSVTLYHSLLLVHCLIVTCVGRSKAPPVPLLPLLYEVCGMAHIERSITNY